MIYEERTLSKIIKIVEGRAAGQTHRLAMLVLMALYQFSADSWLRIVCVCVVRAFVSNHHIAIRFSLRQEPELRGPWSGYLTCKMGKAAVEKGPKR